MANQRVQEMVSLYRDGHSLDSIARRVRRSISTVRYHLQRAGVTLRFAGMPSKEPTPSQAAKLYLAGYNLPLIAKKFNLSVETIRNRLAVAGVKPRGRGRPPNNFSLPVRELQLYLIKGWTVRAIAGALGVSHETVRHRLVLVKRGLDPLGKYDKE
jgi:transposase